MAKPKVPENVLTGKVLKTESITDAGYSQSLRIKGSNHFKLGKNCGGSYLSEFQDEGGSNTYVPKNDVYGFLPLFRPKNNSKI